MDNPIGSIQGSVGAHSEVVNRRSGLPGGFRRPVLVGVAVVAVVASAGWLLLMGPSDREIIDQQFADVGVSATHEGDAPVSAYLYTIDRSCGDEITVTASLGESELDKPRAVTLEESDGSLFVLSDDTASRLLSC